jgi:hypothetical protein
MPHHKGKSFTLGAEVKPVLSDADYKVFPMFVPELKRMPAKHDYLDCKYNLNTGTQIIEPDEDDESQVATLKYKLGVELELLQELGDTQKLDALQEFISDLDRRLAQDPTTKGYLKAYCEEAVAYHWDQKAAQIATVGQKQIEELKRSHKRALAKKKEAIKREHQWLDGESWPEMIEELKQERTHADEAQRADFGRLLNKNRTIQKKFREDMYLVHSRQQDNQLGRSTQFTSLVNDHHKNLQKKIGSFKCRDPYTEAIEQRILKEENAQEAEEEMEVRTKMHEEQNAKRDQIWAELSKRKRAHKQLQDRVEEDLVEAEQGLRIQNAVARRVERMELRLKLQDAQQDMELWVQEEKLKKKLHLIKEKEKRDMKRLAEKPPGADKYGRPYRYVLLKPHEALEGEEAAPPPV